MCIRLPRKRARLELRSKIKFLRPVFQLKYNHCCLISRLQYLTFSFSLSEHVIADNSDVSI